MRFSPAITILALALSAVAFPSSPIIKRQNGLDSQSIIDALNKWRADAEAFKKFADDAPTLSNTDIGFAALGLKASATDEFKQISPLSSIEGYSDKTLESIEFLRRELGFNVMANLLDGISTVSQGPDAGELIESLLVQLNGIRCCNVLPNVDILWEAAATSSGVVGLVELGAPKPAACNDPLVCTG